MLSGIARSLWRPASTATSVARMITPVTKSPLQGYLLSNNAFRNSVNSKLASPTTRAYATATTSSSSSSSSSTHQFKTYTPSSPGRRWLKRVPRDHLWKGKPIRALTIAKRSTAGRNNTGRITVRHRGGGHKRRLRIIDWYRREPGAQIVERLEYDPGRTAWIALLKHQESGKLSYILAPHDLQPGSVIYSFLDKSSWNQAKNGITTTLPIDKGNCLPLSRIPTGTIIHAIGMKRNGGAQVARSAGTYAQLLSTGETGHAIVRLSSGEVRKFPVDVCATIGVVSNPGNMHESLGKAGRSRWMGIRPSVRGVAQNACDHPHGGGKGKTKGGKDPRSPWGTLAKGGKTRKHPNKMVVRERPRRLTKAMLRQTLTRATKAACNTAISSSRKTNGITSTVFAARSFVNRPGLQAARSIHTTISTRFASTLQQQHQVDSLPTVNITTNSSANITITPPEGSSYYRPHQPTTTLSPLWLRDNCPCPDCIHPTTRQKLHASSQIPLDIAIASYNVQPEGLELVWSKGLDDVGDWEDPAKSKPGHKSLYPWEMILGSYGGTPSEHRASTRMNHAPILWDEEIMKKNVLWLDYDEYMNTPEGLLKGLKQLQDYGLFFLKGVPTRDQEVATAAERIGHLRHTFYGRTWDVKSIPNAKNVAYTNLNLGLHMDLLYMEAPPGLQLLHSLENSVPGGTSIFMDSFKAVELLKQQYPEDYDILTKVPNTFHYRNADHHLHYNRTTIVVDPSNSALTVNYAPPFQGPLELPVDQMAGFYRALRRFSEFIERPDLQYRHTMRPGECMVFANRRVLHARTAFDPSKGNRHLKGCYVDLDMFKDKYRTTLAAGAEGKL
ncbi:hypothetical protein BGZ80_011043 [Entomortierella chlamydospora]|uniref:Large ribosomal subunit protein uL2m n=1 Tax=Entomortierella chlamydospora TaxID=101097 RepID=A0A9P6T3S9_9FUNG|nr:hypothetical protein BGZ79_009371 [Entomortierella chlamydospora]KAG0022834.1 hypothetical protein BGZ80_011043 [Entomortierella chlamydospora]